MEFLEPEERSHSFEFSKVQPSELFLAAREHELWLRANVSSQQLPWALDGLVEKLERYISEKLDGQLPELLITSGDIIQTSDIFGHEAGIVTINADQRPLEGDEKVLNEHTVHGRLFGFHRGADNDLRMYVDTGTPPRMLPGGVYHEYLSVSVENSSIQLAAEVQQQEEKRQNEYLDQLISEYDGTINRLYTDLLRAIHGESGEFRPKAQRLRECSQIMVQVEAHPDVNAKLIDGLLGYIAFSLQLNEPHNMEVSDYRIVASSNGFHRGRARIFEGIEPGLCMMGETRARTMGLFFSAEPPRDAVGILPDTQMVQVPVPSIKSIIVRNW